MNYNEINNIMQDLNSSPFLFIGSGITRRYYNLPDWQSLLKIFSSRISSDPFSYSAYESKAKSLNCQSGLYPQIAELIEYDFNNLWFSNPDIRHLDEYYLRTVSNGASPFKAEISQFIHDNSCIIPEYQEEIKKLHSISVKSISGVITTNYDNFLESILDDYKKYVGQEELLFSPIQGIAEIYKIHGSVENPNSIVINKDDYAAFNERSPYLAAKLMTIFMEYPIIFLGYSLTDANVQKIIHSIVSCLSSENLVKLQKRFIFVDYIQGMTGVEISPHSMVIDNKILYMTKISCSDFGILYDAISHKKTELPVKLLRKFKQELYMYTISNTPTSKLRVVNIDDTRINDEELVMAIGKMSDFGLKGLSGLSSSEWYRNIILDDLDFNSDELLEYAFPKLIKQNSNKLPFFKFLSKARQKYPDIEELASNTDFNSIISTSIKNNKSALGHYSSVMDIWSGEANNLYRATFLIAHLDKADINIDDLESILISLFQKDINILEHAGTNIKTNIRRLIRIYDCLKYKNVKEPSD